MPDGAGVPMGEASSMEVIRTNPNSVMSISEQQQLERLQAKDHDYYTVWLVNDATHQLVRVRTLRWVLDAERNPVFDEHGAKVKRNEFEVALDVWAAYGADDHTFLSLEVGSMVRVTADGLAAEIEMGNIKVEA